MDLAIMIEGQAGLTWQRWQRLVQAVEDLGFAGLYRSDHFVISPPYQASLELWVSLTWLAVHTRRIEFGSLVSPVSFRNPVFTARMALAVDDLSHGRLTLGLGAGWNAREHEMFGFDLLPPRQRAERFREGLEVVSRLLRSNAPVNYSGQYFRLNSAIILPRPERAGGPPVLIGGNGERLTLPLVARYADEWNAVEIPPSEFTRLNSILDGLIRREGRNPSQVKRSLMNSTAIGLDRRQVDEKIRLYGTSEEDLRTAGALIGTPEEVIPQLQAYADAGIQRIMLQWLAQDDIAGLEALARTTLLLFPSK